MKTLAISWSILSILESTDYSVLAYAAAKDLELYDLNNMQENT